jgi:ATP synthase protein I
MATPQPPQTPEENTSQALGNGMNLGINLLSSVVVGAAMGYGLDWLFGTLPLFMILMCFLGFGAGLYTIWKAIQNKPSGPQ